MRVFYHLKAKGINLVQPKENVCSDIGLKLLLLSREISTTAVAATTFQSFMNKANTFHSISAQRFSAIFCMSNRSEPSTCEVYEAPTSGFPLDLENLEIGDPVF